ncbi:MAG: restriction endonuclease subunit S [Selenomonadaceae bacterium]|nr:restriction endonuclease subunit S [Selenomonadaceae bacterium]
MKIKLIDVCTPKQWKTIPTSDLLDEGYPVYGANGIIGYYSEFNHEDSVIAVTCRGATCGAINITMPKSYVTGNAMCLDNVRSDIEIEYLYYCLRYYDFNNVISGSAQPQITRQGMEKIVISVCRHDKQVEIINKLRCVEKIIQMRNKQLEYMDELVKARFVEMFGDPISNPMKWETKKLEEYIIFLTSGSRGWAKYFTEKENELFITIKNVKNNKISMNDIQYVEAPKNKEAERTKVKSGDLLISITADLGRTGVVDEEIADRGAYINQHLSLVRLDKNCINPMFVSYYLETEGGKIQFESKNQTGVKAGLNFEAIKSLNIIVPPIELQNKYLSFVQQVDKSKSAIKKSLEETQILFDSLMQKYFG